MIENRRRGFSAAEFETFDRATTRTAFNGVVMVVREKRISDGRFYARQRKSTNVANVAYNTNVFGKSFVASNRKIP